MDKQIHWMGLFFSLFHKEKTILSNYDTYALCIYMQHWETGNINEVFPAILTAEKINFNLSSKRLFSEAKITKTKIWLYTTHITYRVIF